MVLAAPLLTRLYTTEDFGLLAVYSGLLALFAVVASLRYELAIPMPESNAEAANIIILSLLAVLFMTGVSSLIVWLAGQQIAEALDAPNLARFFWLLPVGVLLTGVYKVFNYCAVRNKAFGSIAKTRVSQTLATLIIQIAGHQMGGVALIFGQAGGQGLGSTRLVRSALKHQELTSWTWSGVWQAAKRYKDFPLFSTWSALFNTIGNQLPQIIFAVLFSSSVAGAYLLTQRILGAPIELISSAVSNVFLSSASRAHRENTLGRSIYKLQVKLIYAAIPVFIVFAVISPSLFLFVFGESWVAAGEMARWLSPWFALVFILSPFIVVFEILERQRLGLLFQLIVVILRVASIVLGYLFNSFMLTIQLLSISGVACLLAFNFWVCLATGTDLKGVLKAYICSVLYGIIIASPMAITLLFSNSLMHQVMGGLFSVVIYGVYGLRNFKIMFLK